MIAAIKKQKVLAAGIFAATAGISLLVLTPAPATQAAPTEADLCSEAILTELDVLAESQDNVPSPSWQEVVADCEALGAGPAYSKNVGPALPLCAYEDGSGTPVLPCFWDAKKSGNGKGSSYIVKVAP